MAIPEKDLPATELVRYLNTNGHLISVRDDGTTYVATLNSRGWILYRTKKVEVTLDAWRLAKLERAATLEPWRRKVRKLPALRTLERWSYDGVCKSVTGATVEPDGHGPDGAPSWLLALGLI